GKMVVMIAEEREDAEGDLVMAADKITPDDINFMAREARGVISVAIPDQRFRELGIPLQPSTDNGDSKEQAGVLIEGGANLAGSALSAGIVDRVAFFVAPKIIGVGLPAIDAMRSRRVRDVLALADLSARPVGDDWLLEARITG
ncbi:MAG: 3,4-dihydroxy-2-butanone-4-phosphate synthase, partial [Candidatus Binatus sp.]